MPQKLQNITNTDFLINENRTDFEKTREILRSYPVPLTECARMMCSFLFAAFVSCLQRSFFICSVRFLLAAFLLFAAYIFKLQFSFLICSVLFHLQRFFFVCSVSFLFAALLFCLQRFFFVCSMSLVGHRTPPRPSCKNPEKRAQSACSPNAKQLFPKSLSISHMIKLGKLVKPNEAVSVLEVYSFDLENINWSLLPQKVEFVIKKDVLGSGRFRCHSVLCSSVLSVPPCYLFPRTLGTSAVCSPIPSL